VDLMNQKVLISVLLTPSSRTRTTGLDTGRFSTPYDQVIGRTGAHYDLRPAAGAKRAHTGDSFLSTT